jgi:glutamine synthetase
VAPAQHEVACVYAKVNITTDNNHLLMQIAQDIAKKHGLRCLLHEKPFDGVNGSGKHNNWSVTTNTGVNLFNPGPNPIENLPFLATLAATIKGVDEYAELLRMSAASAGNDHRLGANEAPPAIISIFLGEELDDLVDTIVNGTALSDNTKERFKTGVAVVPDFSKDTTDRNRTSPFAFTGNKFEFRAVGSAQSVAGPNTVLNTILAEEFDQISDAIDAGEKPMDIIKRFLSEHKRIIFNGDGYSKEWEEEAARRGLPNNKNTVDAADCLLDEKNVELYSKHGVYTKVELDSRYEIMLENYSNTLQVEGLTALKMAKNEIYPAVVKYIGKVAKDAKDLAELGVDNSFLKANLEELTTLATKMNAQMATLEEKINTVRSADLDVKETAVFWRDEVLTAMADLRATADKLETLVDEKDWPMPNYVDLMFGI